MYVQLSSLCYYIGKISTETYVEGLSMCGANFGGFSMHRGVEQLPR